jgi:hypothetical protein
LLSGTKIQILTQLRQLRKMNARVYEYVCEHVASLADFIDKKHELIKERQQVPPVVKLEVKLVVKFVVKHVTRLADFTEKKHQRIKGRQQVDLTVSYTSSLRPHALVAESLTH